MVAGIAMIAVIAIIAVIAMNVLIAVIAIIAMNVMAVVSAINAVIAIISINAVIAVILISERKTQMNKELELINLNWEQLGARLAKLSSSEQIPFFKRFCKEMLAYDTHCQMEMQLTYIRDGDGVLKGMTAKEKEIFETLAFSGDEMG